MCLMAVFKRTGQETYSDSVEKLSKTTKPGTSLRADIATRDFPSYVTYDCVRLEP